MTDQTTYRQKIRNEKEEIDLVQMIQYVLQKWKILLLAGVVGLLLGGAFGAMKTGKEPAQMDINDLNADQIQQYANYHQFYEDEVARQKESIYMNMDPEAVYMANKKYYIAAQESDLNRLGLAIGSILQKQDVYDQVREKTGLTCSQRCLAELMSIWFTETEKKAIQLNDDNSNDGRIYISVSAPSEEIGEEILAVLDAQVQAVCAQVAQTAEGGMTYEAMTQTGRTGYNGDVVSARLNGADRLAAYLETLSKIEKDLTDDDKAYYEQVYEGEWKPKNKMLKWAVLGGFAFFVLAGGWFALAFLLDGSVKGTDELEDRYGLHLLARVEPEGAAKKNLRGLDKLFAEKPQYNDGAYLSATLSATGISGLVLSGDLANAQIAQTMKTAAQAGGYKVCDRFEVDVQAVADKMDGVVLFIQPWVTKKAQVLRELEICDFNGLPVIGFVAVG